MAFNPLGSLLNRVFRNELNRMLEELYDKQSQKIKNSDIEDSAINSDKKLEDMTLEEMDKLWEKAKFK